MKHQEFILLQLENVGLFGYGTLKGKNEFFLSTLKLVRRALEATFHSLNFSKHDCIKCFHLFINFFDPSTVQFAYLSSNPQMSPSAQTVKTPKGVSLQHLFCP